MKFVWLAVLFSLSAAAEIAPVRHVVGECPKWSGQFIQRTEKTYSKKLELVTDDNVLLFRDTSALDLVIDGRAEILQERGTIYRYAGGCEKGAIHVRLQTGGHTGEMLYDPLPDGFHFTMIRDGRVVEEADYLSP